MPLPDLCAAGLATARTLGYNSAHVPRAAGPFRYRLRLNEARFQQALGVLRRSGASFGKLFREEEDGKYSEVAG